MNDSISLAVALFSKNDEPEPLPSGNEEYLSLQKSSHSVTESLAEGDTYIILVIVVCPNS